MVSKLTVHNSETTVPAKKNGPFDFVHTAYHLTLEAHAKDLHEFHADYWNTSMLLAVYIPTKCKPHFIQQKQSYRWKNPLPIAS